MLGLSTPAEWQDWLETVGHGILRWLRDPALCRMCTGMMCASDSDPYRLAADKLVERLRDLATDLALPTPRSYGINEQEWKNLTPLMAQQAIDSGSPGNNPVVPEVTEVAAPLRPGLRLTTAGALRCQQTSS